MNSRHSRRERKGGSSLRPLLVKPSFPDVGGAEAAGRLAAEGRRILSVRAGGGGKGVSHQSALRLSPTVGEVGRVGLAEGGAVKSRAVRRSGWFGEGKKGGGTPLNSPPGGKKSEMRLPAKPCLSN